MKHCFKKAYAKINLTLDVLGTRDDGYHELCMVMQQVSLCDTVAVRIGCPWEGIQVISNLGYLPCDDRNIAYKAAKLFLDETGLSSSVGGINIAMEKRIPVSAGLAGGSSDGAAVLSALNELCETNLSLDELCKIGVKIGADVPYCLCGNTMLACGVGEKLSPLPRLPECYIVLCKPGYGMSTPKVFSELDETEIPRHPDTEAMLNALSKGNLKNIASQMYNVLEPVVTASKSDISEIERTMIAAGALGSIMSGSGSTVFGIFDSPAFAKRAYSTLRKHYKDTFFAKSL